MWSAKLLGIDQQWVFADEIPQGKFTIYDALVLESEPIILGIDSNSLVVPYSTPGGDQLLMKELCAGMGGIGLGLLPLGGKIVAALDSSALACKHLQLNQHGSVLCRDLWHDSAKGELHLAGGDAHLIAAGFPCQPHSQQGRRLGSLDPRHRTLTEVLRTAYLHQITALILECTPQAQHDAGVRMEIRHFAEIMDYNIHETTLALSHQWPCRRHRWWVIVCPKTWGPASLLKWPEDPAFNQISSILPGWGVWTTGQEALLQLTTQEIQAFSNPRLGADKRILDLADMAPTFLHSYGSIFDRCPCGCREIPFSMTSLEEKGLRGCLILSLMTGQPRYLHPFEVYALHGVSQSVLCLPDLKGALCLAGQMASPLQAQWILSFLISMAEGKNSEDAFACASAQLASTKTQLVRSHFQLWGPTASVPRTLQIATPDGAIAHILTQGCVTVAQLIHAETFTLGHAQSLHVWDGPQRMPMDQRLLETGAFGPYQLEIHEDPLPIELGQRFMVGIELPNELLIESLFPGDFLFQALTFEQRLHIRHFEDDAGKFYGLDFRVWSTLRLRAVMRQSPATISGPPCGDTSSMSLGLGDHTIWTSLISLCKAHLGPYDEAPLMVTPTLASTFLQGQFQEQQIYGLQELFHRCNGSIYCIFAAHNHWALLHGALKLGQLQWTYFDGLRDHIRSSAEKLALILSFCLQFDFTGLASSCLQEQRHPHTCGTVALIHVCQVLGLKGTLSPLDELRLHQFLHEHQTGKQSFAACGKTSGEIQQSLEQLLLEKGVPSAAVTQRSAEAVRIIGQPALAEALQAKNPWAALKSLASRPSTRFRWVKEDELRQHVATQIKTKGGPTVPKHKAKKASSSGSGSLPAVDPTTLKLVDGTFVDEDDEPLPQLLFEQVSQDAHGISFCTLQDARPFIEACKSISSTTLGLLITTEVPEALVGLADIRSLKFPAICTMTNEPLLIQGSLLTLSDNPIHRKEHQSPNLDVLATVVLKLQIFQDEFVVPWETFLAGPVKNIIAQVPLLRLCRGQSCGDQCGHFHAPVGEELPGMILDVWSRSWFNTAGKTTKPNQASYFQAMLRVPECALDSLVTVATKGVYIEPRAGDVRGPHPDFTVIWLGNLTRDQALHKLRTCSHGLALTRQHRRYGVRVKGVHEKTTHNELKPDDDFIAIQINQTYSIFPVPFGLQKNQVAKLLEAWKWKAKPLQPAKGNMQGQSWIIGTAEPPPSLVLRGFDQDILVTLQKETKVTQYDQPLVASQRTRKFLKDGGGSNLADSDPWVQGSDPWGGWKGTAKPSASAPASTTTGPSRLDHLKQTITDEVKKQVLAAPPGLSAPSASSTQMEVEIKELQAQGAQFKQWFGEAGTRLANNEKQLAQLQTVVEQQGHAVTQQINTIQQEVDNKTSILQNTLQGALHAMTRDLDANLDTKLTQQFDRFEALLAKKTKTSE